MKINININILYLIVVFFIFLFSCKQRDDESTLKSDNLSDPIYPEDGSNRMSVRYYGKFSSEKDEEAARTALSKEGAWLALESFLVRYKIPENEL